LNADSADQADLRRFEDLNFPSSDPPNPHHPPNPRSRKAIADQQLHFQTRPIPLSFAHMKNLYPEIEPFDSGMLKVSDIHEIYYERVGNPEGIPVVFLHGGPGGGLIPMYRQFFDPAAYQVVLFDQRGSGKSTPHAELRENTTWDLINDIEDVAREVRN
jgi:hypothetical protein